MAEENNEPRHEVGFIRGIDLISATTIVVGSMIGSGIFIAPSLMAGYIESPGIIILLWVIGGIFTLCGALSYAELAASMPHAGGQYVFLKEAYRPQLGFLYGWTVFLVIQTGFIAAVAVAFAKYLGIFIPCLSEKVILFSIPLGAGAFSFNSAQAAGIISIIVLTVINCFGVKTGALVQNVFTFLKVGAVLLLIIFGFSMGKGNTANFMPLFEPVIPSALKMGLFAALAVALSKALFAYDAWTTVTFAAEEVHEPQKNLPLSLIVGALIVTFLYTGATAVYFFLVPIKAAAAVPDNRIAAAAAEVIFGPVGLYLISAAVIISTFGCNNGLILGGPRVYYAMAKDRLFFQSLAKLHPRYRAPVNALIIQGAWSCVLTLTGSYSNLLTYTAFASVLFNVLTVVGLFILRKKNPDLHRPYLVHGYPFIPVLYILIGVAFLFYVVQGAPGDSLKGLAIILVGLPVYYWFRSVGRGPSPS
ncbi:MAG: amino acid permease [Candidatus Eremiobacteraeota bacterium]|nr:amino acid permease [Candidatus Eremiobacteraeota bacterium]